MKLPNKTQELSFLPVHSTRTIMYVPTVDSNTEETHILETEFFYVIATTKHDSRVSQSSLIKQGHTARIVLRPVHVPLKRAQSISRLAVWEETRRFKYNIQHRNTRVHRIVNRIELRIQYNLGAFFQERQKIIAKHQEHWRRTFSHTSYKISEALLHYNQSINQSINQSTWNQ